MAESDNEVLEASGDGAQSSMDLLIADCFQIIASVGVAKSSYIGAVQLAKEGKFDEAAQSIADGDQAFKEGHDVHLSLLQRTAAGESIPFTLILLHAEDQMAAAETFRVVANDFIDVHKELAELKGKLS
ncbi:PTS lactose/cellobiose transporter subunit IIA [Paratractidigestivibacter sp.]|uniref:PTS lactose/cellobiose transporter subunit IIA n=1 Tax=Paratractidigestivibacter sp. TaxID=2847316 RepID=UPI002ABD3DA3|nr:PTS lactose/cellobiose transporter subunit IIA [Paratractidigestivibacter sp.]